MAAPWNSVFSSAPSVHFLHCSVLPLHLCLLVLCCLSLNARPSHAQGPEDSTLVISALSRPLDLGTLYNARNDKIITGISLWDREDMKTATVVSPQPNTRFHVAGSETLRDKLNLLDVSASLRVSFMGGLVEVGGSARYLSEKSSSSHQCSVTLKYHVTTEFRELILTELESPDVEVYDKTDATHVVVGVLYGGDALMEFQESFSDESQRRLIEGNLDVMIKKIPGITISGEGSIEMDDDEKNMVKNFVCKFYGDVRLEELPSTYEEAVKVYKELPSLLGSNGENVVPLRVWLYPLSKLSNTALKLKRMISATLVSAIEKVMDDLHHAEVRTNDLLESSKDIKAEDIVTKLEQFQSSLRVFTVEFLRKLGDLIPAIKGGAVVETTLSHLLNSQDAAGFSGTEMEQWLDGKETEIHIVTSNIKLLPDYKDKTKSPGPELDSVLLDPKIRDVIVLSFTSLSHEEPYLKKIAHGAQNLRNGSTRTPEKEPKHEVPWYWSQDIKKNLHSLVGLYKSIPYQNKLISFIHDPKNTGASIQWYHNGALKNPHITSIPLEIFSCELSLNRNTANKHLLLSKRHRRVSRVWPVRGYPYHKDRFDVQRQVLSKQPLPERCYWESEWSANGQGITGLAYSSLKRKGNKVDSFLGLNTKSWMLERTRKNILVRHGLKNRVDLKRKTNYSATKRIGVFVDKEAGTVSFYGVSSGKRTHLHTFYTRFSKEKLYAGFHVYGGSVTLI